VERKPGFTGTQQSIDLKQLFCSAFQSSNVPGFLENTGVGREEEKLLHTAKFIKQKKPKTPRRFKNTGTLEHAAFFSLFLIIINIFIYINQQLSELHPPENLRSSVPMTLFQPQKFGTPSA